MPSLSFLHQLASLEQDPQSAFRLPKSSPIEQAAFKKITSNAILLGVPGKSIYDVSYKQIQKGIWEIFKSCISVYNRRGYGWIGKEDFWMAVWFDLSMIRYTVSGTKDNTLYKYLPHIVHFYAKSKEAALEYSAPRDLWKTVGSKYLLQRVIDTWNRRTYNQTYWDPDTTDGARTRTWGHITNCNEYTTDQAYGDKDTPRSPPRHVRFVSPESSVSSLCETPSSLDSLSDMDEESDGMGDVEDDVCSEADTEWNEEGDENFADKEKFDHSERYNNSPPSCTSHDNVELAKEKQDLRKTAGNEARSKPISGGKRAFPDDMAEESAAYSQGYFKRIRMKFIDRPQEIQWNKMSWY
ncbi:hypothetical protein GGR54DRAFT_636804 [Hypoxylon sp. NC1633]|nr:hypothetical protein GGR54DRAFT_636804 [Hypoxylon sp. NC1633]